MQEIGTNLKLVSKKSKSFFRNGGIPLCYVDPKGSTIRICTEGWNRLSDIKGYGNMRQFFSLEGGIRAIALAIAHESIHQVLYKLENENTSLDLDTVSGAGEMV
jgi:hypothetical protein